MWRFELLARGGSAKFCHVLHAVYYAGSSVLYSRLGSVLDVGCRYLIVIMCVLYIYIYSLE